MMCDVVTRIDFASFDILCQGPASAAQLGGLVALAAIAVQAAWLLRAARGALAWAGGLLGIVGALALGIAAGLPELRPVGPPPPGGTLIVLVDGSGSALRDGGAERASALASARARIGGSVTALPPEIRDAWTASVLDFGRLPESRVDAIALPLLEQALADGGRVTPLGGGEGAGQGATDIAAALEAGQRLISNAGQGGAIWLLTDGNETQGDAMSQIGKLSAAGIPVHVLPFGTTQPASGLLSSDIGPDQAVGRPATVRLTTLGAGALSWDINGIAAPARSVDAGGGVPRGVHLKAEFAQRGINHVSLALAPEPGGAGRSGAVQGRRLYALVRGPAQILLYGEGRWLEGADPERFVIVRASPGDDVDLGRHDAVVVDGLAPDAFAEGFAELLLSAGAGGTGIFIVNGPLRSDVTAPQRISDWEETALGPVLPVSADPQLFLDEPPARDILIIVDTSGSMQGGRMQQAKSVVFEIIDQLRPVDTLQVIPFASTTGQRFPSGGARAFVATQGTKTAAKEFVSRFQAAGGTNTDAALRAVQGLQGQNCALFLVSDGDFNSVATPPSCYMTAIGVDGAGYPQGFVDFGQEIRLPFGRGLGTLEFKLFEPEERDRFWLDGPLKVIGNAKDDRLAPPTTLTGLALGYPRVDARVQSIHRGETPPVNPVLLLRSDPVVQTLTTGVFMGEAPASWATSPAGRLAVDTLLEELIAWDEPRRFDIDITQDNDQFAMTVTHVGAGLAPGTLSASLRLEDGTEVPFAAQPGTRPGVFHFDALVRLHGTPQRAGLMLSESDRTQLIPALLPAAHVVSSDTSGKATAEDLTNGINGPLLRALRERTGGADLRYETPTIRYDTPPPRRDPLWPALAAAGLALFSASLFSGGVRR